MIERRPFTICLWGAVAAMLLCAASLAPTAAADVRLPHIFDSNMVLQRDKPVRVWGWADRGETVTVEFAGQETTAKANSAGKWALALEAMEASSQPRPLVARDKANTVRFENVLVGEVWVLGGQSNMEHALPSVYHGDVEMASAHFPAVRLMTVPASACPEPADDFPRINEFNAWSKQYEKKGFWMACSPETVVRFSAIGYVFGRRVHAAARVPVGLIDASWGGTTVEAWTGRRMLATVPEAAPLLKEWDAKIAAYDPAKDLQERIARWEKDTERRKKEGQQPQPKPAEPRPGPAFDRNNPGASYSGMIAPFAGLTVRGAIFNQGYNNALGNARPRLYAKAFNAMVRDWRRAFGDEQMPFGIVELTAGGQPQTLENFEERMVDAAPYLREGQLKAYRDLPNVGFVCAYDQQMPWYHPFKKVQLGERIARWALATQHGLKLGWEPAVCTSAEAAGERMLVTFSKPVQAHDGRPIEGFAIAGKDGHFYPARARYLVVGKDNRGRDRHDRQKLEIWSDLVKQPLAVRYAWARNPLGNLVNDAHSERILPVPSFRTDDWDWPEAPFAERGSPEEAQHRRQLAELRSAAREWARQRPIQEAKAVLERADGQ